MPYQRSTQAKGFTKRTVSDESKKLKEYATVLDKQRKEDVKLGSVKTLYGQEKLHVSTNLLRQKIHMN